MKIDEEKMWEPCNDFVARLRFLELALEHQESSRNRRRSLQANTYENLFPENSSRVTGRFYKAKGSCPEIFTARLRYYIYHLRWSFTFLDAISLEVLDIAFQAVLTPKPSGVMQAVDAFTTLGLANLWSFDWVHVAMTLALGTDAVGIVIAVFTCVAILARVTVFALDTRRLQVIQFWEREDVNLI